MTINARSINPEQMKQFSGMKSKLLKSKAFLKKNPKGFTPSKSKGGGGRKPHGAQPFTTGGRGHASIVPRKIPQHLKDKFKGLKPRKYPTGGGKQPYGGGGRRPHGGVPKNGDGRKPHPKIPDWKKDIKKLPIKKAKPNTSNPFHPTEKDRWGHPKRMPIEACFTAAGCPDYRGDQSTGLPWTKEGMEDPTKPFYQEKQARLKRIREREQKKRDDYYKDNPRPENPLRDHKNWRFSQGNIFDHNNPNVELNTPAEATAARLRMAARAAYKKKYGKKPPAGWAGTMKNGRLWEPRGEGEKHGLRLGIDNRPKAERIAAAQEEAYQRSEDIRVAQVYAQYDKDMEAWQKKKDQTNWGRNPAGWEGHPDYVAPKPRKPRPSKPSWFATTKRKQKTDGGYGGYSQLGSGQGGYY